MRVERYGENGGPSGGPVSQGGAPAEETQGQGPGGATKSVSGFGYPPLPEHRLPLSPVLRLSPHPAPDCSPVPIPILSIDTVYCHVPQLFLHQHNVFQVIVKLEIQDRRTLPPPWVGGRS